MSVLCPGCDRIYKTAILEMGGLLSCRCGAIVGLEVVHKRSRERESGRKKMRALERMANRVCALILNDRYPEVDVAIEIERVRTEAERLFPGRGELFRMVYQSRFDRLRDQFRGQR